MAKLKAIRTNQDRIEDGVWVDYVEDVRLCIASINSKAYRQHKDRLLKPYIRQVRAGNLSTDRVLEIIKPAVAHHLLRDWKNIEDDDGKAIPYSPDKAIEFFENPNMADLYSFVLETAGEINNYREEFLEESQGN